MMVAELNAERPNISDCTSIIVPAGDHLVTAPVHFGAASVYMFGSGESSEDVTISCNYTVDVDEYTYIDYTVYFNRSEVVSFEMVQFVGCPFPLRLDTVAAVTVSNSTFRLVIKKVISYSSANPFLLSKITGASQRQY